MLGTVSQDMRHTLLRGSLHPKQREGSIQMSAAWMTGQDLCESITLGSSRDRLSA